MKSCSHFSMLGGVREEVFRFRFVVAPGALPSQTWECLPEGRTRLRVQDGDNMKSCWDRTGLRLILVDGSDGYLTIFKTHWCFYAGILYEIAPASLPVVLISGFNGRSLSVLTLFLGVDILRKWAVFPTFRVNVLLPFSGSKPDASCFSQVDSTLYIHWCKHPRHVSTSLLRLSSAVIDITTRVLIILGLYSLERNSICFLFPTGTFLVCTSCIN